MANVFFFVPSLLYPCLSHASCRVRYILGMQGIVIVYLSIELEMLYQIPAHGKLAVGNAAGRSSPLALSSPKGGRLLNSRISPRSKFKHTRAVSMHVAMMVKQTSLRPRL